MGTPFGKITSREDRLPLDHYIMLELDFIPAGEYIFTTCMQHCTDDQTKLILKFSIFDQTPQRTLLAKIELPVVYDMGSNCVLYDLSEEESTAEWQRVYDILILRAKELGEVVYEEPDDHLRDMDYRPSLRQRVNSRYNQPAERRITRALSKRVHGDRRTGVISGRVRRDRR